MPSRKTLLNGLTRESASADRRGRGTLLCKVGKRLERRRGPGICPVSIVPRMRLELTRTLLPKGF